MIATHEVLEPDAERARLTRVSQDGARLAWAVDDRVFAGELAAGDARDLELEADGRLLDLAFAPEGERLACLVGHELPESQSVVVLDVGTGAEIFRAEAAAFAWLPDGDLAFLSIEARKLYVFEARKAAAAELAPIHHTGRATNLPRIAVSASGKRIAVASRREHEDVGEVWMVSRASGRAELLTQLPNASVEALPLFAPDGKTLALAAYDVENAQGGLCVLPDKVLLRSIASPPKAAWSPSGRSIVIATSARADESTFSVVDVATGATEALAVFDGSPQFLSEDSLVFDGGARAHALALTHAL